LLEGLAILAAPFARCAEPLSWLPGDDAIGAAAGEQFAPAVARGGELLLVAWADRRSGATQFSELETVGDIHAVRLDAAGSPLESLPFVVTQERATQQNSKISWNGSHWLVVFESYDLGGTGYYYEQTLEAVRVAPGGAVLDAAPIKIRNVVPTGSDWAVTSNGTDWPDGVRAAPGDTRFATAPRTVIFTARRRTRV
jgi:hypothetical protein